MTPAQWQRVTQLFGEAKELPAAERLAFLERACPDDARVRDEVRSLLDADRDDAFLERGAAVQPRDLLDEAGGHAFAPGESLGPYRIERLLARGGMGVLYVATDPRLSRRVTLKVLPAAAARDPDARTRLQREARTAARLRHPHVVSVHALEEIGDLLVIVAEYVEGPTLAEVLASEGPLPRDRWLEMAVALAEALAAAHDAQVVHRDVKTRNVVLGADGIRLLDFGIAIGAGEAADARLTRTGLVTGTPLAMAPEQLEGGTATPLSDQYAFGLLLYEAASGRLPFGEGAVAGVWARMLRDEPVPLSGVAPQLTADDVVLVHRCLSRRPEDRFPSMRAVADALRASAPARGVPLDAAAGAQDGVAADGEEVDLSHRSLQRGLQGGGEDVSRRSLQRSPRGEGGWWDLHQAVTATLYVGLLWPGWLVASALPGRWRPAAHITLVCLAATATSLRLHLWFSARHYPGPVAAARRRLWPALTIIDVIYAALLAVVALLVADVRLVPAVVTAGLAVCLFMASVVIEPATRRAETQSSPNTSL